MPKLASIHLYPIKSTAGMPLTRALVTEEGLQGDRRYMVVKPDGSFITARTHPQLQQVVATPIEGGLQLRYPGLDPLILQEQEFSRTPRATGVWSDSFSALQTQPQADAWLSQVAGEPVQLLWLGEESARFREKTGTRVSFADGYPLLLISQASLEDLNLRSDALHQMSQFRTNLVASGTLPFEEDSWKRIRIGEVEFRVAKPCSRCIMTTVEPGTDRFNALKEPLATLTRYRRGEDGEVYFGQNLVALNEGWIEAGSEIEVLERARAPVYPNAAPKKRELVCVAREPLARDLETFWFEAADGEPLPDYLPGQHLPISLDIGLGLRRERLQRRYTLSSTPERPERYSISVKKVGGGRISHWLHQQLQPGDLLLAAAPAGEFHLGTGRSLLLLSAGSGVTPMLSIARTLALRGELGDVHFMHLCRSEADIPAASELHALAQQGMTLTLSLSQPDTHWQGLKGRLDDELLKQVKQLAEREVFICGPHGFMADAAARLTALGVPAERIRQESFGGAILSVARPHQAVQLRIGKQSFAGNNQGTVLDQAHKQGVDLPWSCRAGICGSCKQTLLAGEVDHPDAPAITAAERAEGKILTCCAVPLTDLVIK
ncbi:hybrid-cluster NAD(P)-dependent oxidoreductase [Aeromonas hydrophila]|uniref:hybrid-cluster NAD(P)-dependent oxidoreductase n=1 Tax=Aeromonas hydrophila TaxID=644 RepID=UPI001CF028AF|nr:hybrid-cluster NAD(P)-dependent oxidoreductase [Aeromonas hydrophila]MCK0187414.1 hybrid-cluster NAD(P)-dependent oxidoreductase [Aeromonas hydrophila]MCR3951087.1 hybrid-cluster NAD(P)-dependent oxidoreductase [Aeromonas hydrophila]MCW4613747.1 hybrid-cluster NAD(P)-dependent oxidoreductase [Aeromonas hydrophila]UCM56248.1 hybrid-cluster NAD(P)-dependent oxidoreductase [Aeromonas hydrophila]UOV90669.1 hybrid-cluster NAD(P)-dependent oxidoreductase [Aeromonas hydrophila]